MKYITTAILLVLTVVMGVYAAVHKENKAQSGAGGAKRVFASFAPDKARSIVWQRGDKKIRLEKKDGKWRIVAPIVFRANEDTVGTLLTDLETLIYHRRIKNEISNKEYKLTEPKVVVRVRGALPKDKEAVLRLGGFDLTESKVYVSRGDENDVLVVDKHINESMNKTLADLRDPHVLLFDALKLKKVELVRPGRALRLRKEKKRFYLIDGAGNTRCRAHGETAEALVRKIEDLQISRFVADGKNALAANGLTAETTRVVVETDKTKKLLLGGVCRKGDKTFDGEILAGRPGDSPAVFCIKAQTLDRLFRPPEELRDIKLLTSAAADLEKITIRSSTATLVLENDADKGWRIRNAKDTGDATGANAGKGLASDEEIISKFIDDIQAFTILGFSFPQESALAQYGLQSPQARITFKKNDGTVETLLMGNTSAEHLFVRRKGERAVLTVHKELASRFAPSELAFRERQILEFEQLDAKKIVTKTGTITEELYKKDGQWKLKKPIALDADEGAVGALLRALSTLKAQRYVARRSRPQFGFSAPNARKISCTLEPEPAFAPRPSSKNEKVEKDKKTVYEIEVGADVQDGQGCYARARSGDGWVFVLDALACTDLRALLATRTVVDVTAPVVRTVSYRGPKGVEELEKRGPQWHRKAGPKVKNTSVESLLSALDNLTAGKVWAYGAPGPEHGADKPHITVTVTTDKKEKISVVLGKEHMEKEKSAGRLGWRVGRDVIYVIPSHAVKALEEVTF